MAKIFMKIRSKISLKVHRNSRISLTKMNKFSRISFNQKFDENPIINVIKFE